jgi:quinol monooxygenase YgiN
VAEEVCNLIVSGEEALHDALSPSGRLMAVLGSVIQSPMLAMLDTRHDLSQGHCQSLAWDAFHWRHWLQGLRLVASRSGQRWLDASPINLPEEVTMYARLTTFRVKPDKIGDMLRWRQENEAAIYAQLGLREWIGLLDEEGEVFVVSLFDDEQTARDSMPHVWALWEQMAPMLQGTPRARFLDVMAAQSFAPLGAATA